MGSATKTARGSATRVQQPKEKLGSETKVRQPRWQLGSATKTGRFRNYAPPKPRFGNEVVESVDTSILKFYWPQVQTLESRCRASTGALFFS